MNNKLNILETKKMIKEYIYLLSDEEYKKEIIEKNKNIFLEEINNKKIKLGFKDVQEISEQTNIEYENKKKDINNNQKFSTNKKIKKIYREIVKNTHPDKTSSKEKNDKYIEAKKSYENGDFVNLYLIATDLDLNFELENEDINLMKINIQEKKKYLSNIEQSYLWIWFNSKNESEKDKVINAFINNTTK